MELTFPQDIALLCAGCAFLGLLIGIALGSLFKRPAARLPAIDHFGSLIQEQEHAARMNGC